MTQPRLPLLLSLARRHFPGNSLGAMALQAQFVIAGFRNRGLVAQLLSPPAASALHIIMAKRPKLIGALVWPYQCASFDAAERLRRVVGHYAVIDLLGAPFRFTSDERLVIADLGEVLPGLQLVLDQPEWFLREGGLTLNLFIDSFRAFSVAFSFLQDSDGRLIVTIGGVQGRNRDDMLEVYRELTKLLHGLRPRDFLIEVLRMLCRTLNAAELRAVTEGARHHRHPYFGPAFPTSNNYDEMWEDRGGVRLDKDFFALPVTKDRRDEVTIKPNKRPMYRRRYEFLDELEAAIAARLPELAPSRFVDT